MDDIDLEEQVISSDEVGGIPAGLIEETVVVPVYTDVQNPQYSAPDNSTIDCDVLFSHETQFLRFTANPLDVMPYGVEIFNRCFAGDFGVIAPYVAPVVLPSDVSLTADQFYTLLDTLGELDNFINAIETVTLVAKKLTCRNQFNNSTTFTWDMVLMTLVAPIVWGATWQDDIGPAWVTAG